MTRLVEYLKDTPPSAAESTPSVTAPHVVEVFDFPDRPQPSVRETAKRMAREVVAPSKPGYESAEEMETLFARAEQMDAPNAKGPSVSSAFDQGARLNQPKPPDGPVDPALKMPASRGPRPRSSPGGRPAGSDQFTDLFAAGLITLLSFTLGEDFLPTEDEAKDLSRPLGNILARRIDLATKLGQDANDVVAFAVALMAYLVRVGPIATDKMRESYRDRQERLRTRTIAEPSYGGGEDSLATRDDASPSTGYGSPRRAIDVVTQARDAQLGVLDRDLGYSANGGSPLADHG